VKRRDWIIYGLPSVLLWLNACSAPAVAQGEPGQTSLRFVSYNIKHGQGNDGRVDLGRTAKALKDLDPDLVGLQEVDAGARRSGDVDQAAELGKRLGMHHAFAAFMDFQGGQYGLAVLSKHPINRVESIRLPTGNEPRVALAAEIDIDGKRLMLVNLHFDWVGDDNFRFAQAQTLRKRLAEFDLPTVVLGDFNDQPDSRTVNLFRDEFLEADKPERDRFTIPSVDPRSEIDFLFAGPAKRWEVDRVDVIDQPLASDHRPVLAEMTLRP